MANKKVCPTPREKLEDSPVGRKDASCLRDGP